MKIPTEFHTLFWDCPVEDLTWEDDKYYITARFLEYGNFRGLNWLHREYGLYDFLPEFLTTGYARQLGKRTLNFWKLILKMDNLPWETEDYRRHREKYWTH